VDEVGEEAFHAAIDWRKVLADVEDAHREFG
jgi:hypothetical protein